MECNREADRATREFYYEPYGCALKMSRADYLVFPDKKRLISL